MGLHALLKDCSRIAQTFPLGSFSDRLGAVLERLWNRLGASWERLWRRLWSVLERLRGVFKRPGRGPRALFSKVAKIIKK